MAQFTGTANSNGYNNVASTPAFQDFRNAGAYFLQQTSSYRVSGSGGELYIFVGLNMQYQNGFPVSGTLTGVAYYSSPSANGAGWTITGLSTDIATLAAALNANDPAAYYSALFAQADTIDAGPANVADVINGYAGADVISGGAGSDTLSGGADNDVLYGNQDNDILYGNQDNDVLYGGQGNDAAYGGQGDDVIFGNVGDDSLYGNLGNDTLNGGVGSNLLDGGDGIDTVTYADAAAGVTVSLLSAGSAQATGVSTDTLIGIENLVGSAVNDVLTGDANANVLDGGAGDDTLNGGFGLDVLYGGAGADLLYGNQDADLLYGGTENDQLYGGQGADVLYGDNGNDVLNGNADNDVLYGGAGGDRSYGGLGQDVMYGGAGDDTLWHGDNAVPGLAHDDGSVDALYGDAGSDSIFVGLGDYADGGADYDRVYVSFFARTFGLTLDLNTDLATATSRLQTASGATLLNFEELDVYGTRYDDQLTGSGRPDRLFGGDGNNILYGLGSDDILSGGYNNDQLFGGTGNDTFYYVGGTDTEFGEAGNDQFWLGSSFAGDAIVVGSLTIDGGADTDTIDFSRLPTAVSFALGQTAPQPVAGGTVTIVNVENVIGSNGPDVLYGTAGANVMYGLIGNDAIVAGAGADVVYGGDGDDQLFGSSSGNGSNSPAGVIDGADVLYGEAGNDVLRGREGDDALYGGLGNDNLRGDLGSDYLDGGDGNDIVAYRFDDIGATAGVTFNAAAVGTSADLFLSDGRGGIDHLIGIEQVGISGTPFADVLTVGQAGGQAIGGAGDDLITAGAGSDVLTGNDIAPGVDGGNDTVSYATATAAVTVSLAIQDGSSQATGGSGVDVLLNFDNLIGSAFNDTLIGDGAANVLTGGDGADTLSGGAGGDTLNGGTGDDILYGNQDNDILYGNQDNDVLYGGQGDDVLYGGQGDDVLLGNIGGDLLYGNLGVDTFRYSLSSDSTPSAPDLIADFATGIDKLDLRSIRTGTSDTFTIYNGGASAPLTFVDVDLGGDNTVDMRITLSGTGAIIASDIQWT